MRKSRVSPLCRLLQLGLVTVFAVALPSVLKAQVGSTTDIVLGRVTGPDSLPLENARVEVTSPESGITRNRLTNAKGQYSIVFPDGGGAYQLRVTYLGMAPFQTTIQRQGRRRPPRRQRPDVAGPGP